MWFYVTVNKAQFHALSGDMNILTGFILPLILKNILGFKYDIDQITNYKTHQ